MMKIATTVLIACISSTLATPVDVRRGIDWRVIGGKTAEPGQFPFICSLRVGNSHNCGCSLIRRDVAVTAAHCVKGYDEGMLAVVCGTNQLDAGGERVGILNMTAHPDYNPSKIVNDVAVIKLAKAFEFSDLIQPIALGCKYIDVDQDCTLAGWGRTSYPGNLPNDLQYLPLRSLSYQDCKNKLANINEVFPTEICTLTKEGEGACHGDSGGPLITLDEGVPKLIGGVSWGSPCARGYPDVYTRIASFCDWIEEQIN